MTVPPAHYVCTIINIGKVDVPFTHPVHVAHVDTELLVADAHIEVTLSSVSPFGALAKNLAADA